MVAGISKLARLPVSLPTQPLPDGIELEQVASGFQNVLSRITNPSTYVQDAVWRDTFCFTGTLRTFYSATNIAKGLEEAFKRSVAPLDGSLGILSHLAKVMTLPSGQKWVEIPGSFKIRTVNGLTGICTIMMGVVWYYNDWKIWTLRTILDDVEGWPSVNELAPQTQLESVNGYENGAQRNGTSLTPPFFEVVVIGGGQAGLSVAGRLEALGIRYLLIDKYHQVGDSWASRYESARLHTIREYAHLPFDRTFPKSRYQEFLTKDDLARGYREWTDKYGIDDHIWTETKLESGKWNESEQSWTLNLLRENCKEIVNCRFVVLATGPGGQMPWMPNLPGRDQYQGLLLHSKDYLSAKDWEGKSAIVVGTANTAHDIAEDMYQAGLSEVTMVQRSKTYVLPYEYWQKLSSQTYNENFPTDLADKLQMTGPMAVGRLIINSHLNAMADKEPERFEALSRAGFENESHGDLMWHLLERAGGHYMDVGTSQKIATGKVSGLVSCLHSHIRS